jgi:hypothetical protein
MGFIYQQQPITNSHAYRKLAHLREQADFVRILGSYPQKSRLVGPVAAEVEELKNMVVDPVSLDSLPSDLEMENQLKIGATFRCW